MNMANVAVIDAQFRSLTKEVAQSDVVAAQLELEEAWPGMVEAQLAVVESQLAMAETHHS